MNQTGEVVALGGQVTAVSGDESRVLEIGAPVYRGDEIVTGPNANVEIRFTDDSVLAQGPSASMSLDEYVFDPDQPSASNMLYEAATGTFRVVTGKIADLNPDGVEVKTPLATIGIRGTGMDIESKDEGLKVGIFYYHQFDVVITSPTGTRFITDGGILIEIFPDGTFGEPRPYTAEEKMTFETLAPITSLGDITDEDEGEDEQEGEEGQESEGEEDAEEAEEGEQPTEETVEVQVEEVFPVITGLLGMDVTLLVPPGQDLDFGDALPDFADVDYDILDEDEIVTEEAAGETQTNVITGTSGNDVLLGSDSDETLSGLAGNDYLFGGGGDDWIIGGAGRDSLYGGDGDDTFVFYTGDAVSGEIIDGDAGNNQIYVISNDADFSGASLYGSTFTNILLGSGQTAEFGGSQISGHSWAIYGQGGNSLTVGDCCGQTVDLRGLSFMAMGGQYMDQLIIDASGAVFQFTADQLLAIPGGLKIGVPPGGDIYSLSFLVDPGSYTGSLYDLFDFSGVSGHPSISTLAGDTLTGTQGADTIIGTSGPDSILAKDGADSVVGDLGNDTIYGCDGDDTIEGGGGADYIYGGEGDDQLYFDTDQTGGYIYGGYGTDSLVIEGDADLSQVGYFNSIEALVFGSAGSRVTFQGGDIYYWDVFGNSLNNLEIVAVGGTNTWYNYSYLNRLGPFTDWNGRVIFLDGGYNDHVYGSSTSDSMIGGLGNDTLNDDEGNDTLSGGSGNDCLMGGIGDDSLSGGTGNDTLDPGQGSNTALGGSGTDLLLLNYTSAGLHTTLTVGSGTITHDGASVDYSGIEGFVGTGGTDSLLGTSADDIIYGYSGNDTIDGAGGNDSLFGGVGSSYYSDSLVGGAGNDYLDGGYYYDTLVGGTGNDTADGGLHDDSILGGAGDDTLEGSSGDDTMLGGDDDDSLIGGSDDDSMFGEAHNDYLNGSGGADWMDGGSGHDSLYGGSGTYADTMLGGTGNDSLDGFYGDDSMLGGDGNDVLVGGYGNDELDGGADNDILDGGYGNDTLNGDTGDDCLIGGDGQDFVDYSWITSSLTIDLTAGTVSGASVDTLSGIEGIIGTDTGGPGDYITGGSEDNYFFGLKGDDTLEAGGGNDTLDGGDGDDCLWGGSGDDWMNPGTDATSGDQVEVHGVSGFDVLWLGYSSLAIDSAFTPGDGMLTHDGVTINFYDIDGLAGTGFDDTLNAEPGEHTALFGMDGNDSINGDTGNDTLVGGEDNDTIQGGSGTDSLVGGAGLDSLMGDLGEDTLIGGEGNDTLEGGGDDDLLTGGDQNDFLDGQAGQDTVSGESGNDRVFGGDDGDSLMGGDGYDTLMGEQGNDTLDGGDGSDSLVGGTEADYLLGGDDYDTLWGDIENDTNFAGDDTLMGGYGGDRLYGGLGANLLSGGNDYLTDKFVFDEFKNGDGIDQVTDFDFYDEDHIWINASASLFVTPAPTMPYYHTGLNTATADLKVFYPLFATSYWMTTLTTIRSTATNPYNTTMTYMGYNFSTQRSSQFTNTYFTHHLLDPPDQTITIGTKQWFLTNSAYNVDSNHSSSYSAWYTRMSTHWIATYTKTTYTGTTLPTISTLSIANVRGTFSNANAGARIPYLWRITEITAALGDTLPTDHAVAFVWDTANRELEAWLVETGDTNTTQITQYAIASFTGSGDPGMDSDIYIY